MSNDLNQPIYNLRSKRIRANGEHSPPLAPLSEGFIRASDLLYRQSVTIGDSGTPKGDIEESAQAQELVLDLPQKRDDEGGSVSEADRPSEVAATGDQRIDDSTGEAPRSDSSSSCSVVAEQDAHDNGPEVFRLRIRVLNKLTHRYEYHDVWINPNNI